MDNVYWVVLKKGFFSSKAVALFTTRERATNYAEIEEAFGGIYVVQRVLLYS